MTRYDNNLGAYVDTETGRPLTADQCEAYGLDPGARWNPGTAYDVQCREATKQQGLTPVVDRLTAEAIPFEVEQTGGFCMVVVIPVGRHHICVVNEATDGDIDNPYMTCLYRNGDWHSGHRDEYGEDELEWLSLDGLVAFTRAAFAEFDTGPPALTAHAQKAFANAVTELAQSTAEVYRLWIDLGLPGDYITPETGYPFAHSLDEAAALMDGWAEREQSKAVVARVYSERQAERRATPDPRKEIIFEDDPRLREAYGNVNEE